MRAGPRCRSAVRAALRHGVAVMPLDTSAITRTRVAAGGLDRERDVAAGRPGRLVHDRPRQADQDRFRRFAKTGCTDVGRRRDRARPALLDRPSAAGRSSSCPYGSASRPRISSPAPRPGAPTPSGSLTTIPPLGSAIAKSDGVPRRPGSAVTTPRTVTVVPTVRVRAVAIVTTERAGVGVADGDAVGAGLGVGGAVGPGDAVGVGGRAVGVGVGVGVGWASGGAAPGSRDRQPG